ncbi:hypothetical protein QOT17_008552 [Balamuthia mandrillaris]
MKFESYGLLAFLLVLVGSTHVQGALVRTYENCKVLRESTTASTDYKLYWNIVGENIELAVEVTTVGWVGLGIATQPNMLSGGAGSDIMLGWVAEGECSDGCLFDYWVKEREGIAQPLILDEDLPENAGTQSAMLFAALEVDGVTTLEWTRALDTGETGADRPINSDEPVWVIFASNLLADPSDSRTFSIHSTGTNAAMSITFGEPSSCTSDGGDGETDDGASTDGNDGDGDSDETESNASIISSFIIIG